MGALLWRFRLGVKCAVVDAIVPYFWYTQGMPKKGMKGRTARVSRPEDSNEVEAGLEYWLEHVVHWYVLLGAVMAVLVVGYALFANHAAIAGS